jgi:hypothetical protein
LLDAVSFAIAAATGVTWTGVGGVTGGFSGGFSFASPGVGWFHSAIKTSCLKSIEDQDKITSKANLENRE